jgi:hypothetical protein
MRTCRCTWGAEVAARGQPADPARRLPAGVMPLHYAWTLQPGGVGGGGGDSAHYSGSVDLTLSLRPGEPPSACVPLHAHPGRLRIVGVAVVVQAEAAGRHGGGGRGGRGGRAPPPPPTPTPTSTVRCLCDESRPGETPAGCAAHACTGTVVTRPAGGGDDQLVLRLSGGGAGSAPSGVAINNLMARPGLNLTLRVRYRGTYPTASDPSAGSGLFLSAPSAHTAPVLVTQFESYGARRALPCMDEPALKATFDVQYVLPRASKLVALANMPPRNGANPVAHPDLPEMDVHSFERTPLMPTYLLCVAIGELVGVPSFAPGLEGTEITVWAVPEHASLLQNAAAHSAAAFSFMERFTGVKYALPKADLVAVPGKSGAMENWGLLLMDETRFLVNRSTEGEHAQLASANIICHEIAHQWFGDYVTMKWWTDIWSVCLGLCANVLSASHRSLEPCASI